MSNTTDSTDDSASSVGRRNVLKLLGVAGVAGASTVASSAARTSSGNDELPPEAAPPAGEFDPLEATAADIVERYRTNQSTVRSVVKQYLKRIIKYDDELQSVLTINPNALERADELDEALDSDGLVGPLHGIPILLKDNNDTADMPTTAGSVSLQDSVPPEDATLVTKLREAGGIILGKTNMDEFAFGYSTFSSLGGQTHNPYDLNRLPGGSSGGTGAAIAANFAVLGTGTDTGGSIRVPAAANNLVGLRPSTGLISRKGIVPLNLSEDVAGPMTRTVADAALMTDVMVGIDDEDPYTAESYSQTPHSEGEQYTDYLNEDGLVGVRIGVYRDYVPDSGEVADLFNAALDDMEDAGATIVYPIEIPPENLVSEANVDTRLEFNRDLNDYLETLDDGPETLSEIIDSEQYSPDHCWSMHDRESVDVDGLDENTEYLYGLSKRNDLQHVVLGSMNEATLDAIVYPVISDVPTIDDGQWGANARLSPALDFPALTMPAGFTDDSVPVPIEFLGKQFAEPTLFELAYAYEQVAPHRESPEDFGSIEEASTDLSPEAIEAWNEDQRQEITVEATGKGC